MRMCTACREMRAKKDLLRVVRTADGTLAFDPTGKLNGRGAYLCCDEACLRKAIKTRALERALEAPASEALFAVLAGEVEARGSAV